MLFGIFILFYIDIFYLLVFKILYNDENYQLYLGEGFLKSMNFVLMLFFYLLLNVFSPTYILLRIKEVKMCVKNLGIAKGEFYEKIGPSSYDMAVETV